MFELSCELDLACDLIGVGAGLESALIFIVLSIRLRWLLSLKIWLILEPTTGGLYGGILSNTRILGVFCSSRFIIAVCACLIELTWVEVVPSRSL